LILTVINTILLLTLNHSGSSAEANYTLPGGRYLMLLHCDDPSQEKNYSLIVRASCYLQIQWVFNNQSQRYNHVKS